MTEHDTIPSSVTVTTSSTVDSMFVPTSMGGGHRASLEIQPFLL